MLIYLFISVWNDLLLSSMQDLHYGHRYLYHYLPSQVLQRPICCKTKSAMLLHIKTFNFSLNLFQSTSYTISSEAELYLIISYKNTVFISHVTPSVKIPYLYVQNGVGVSYKWTAWKCEKINRRVSTLRRSFWRIAIRFIGGSRKVL